MTHSYSTVQYSDTPPPSPLALQTHIFPSLLKKGSRVQAALSALVASLTTETPPEAAAAADTSADSPKPAANGSHSVAESASSTPAAANGSDSAKDPADAVAAPAPAQALAPAKISSGAVPSAPKAGGLRWAVGDLVVMMSNVCFCQPKNEKHPPQTLKPNPTTTASTMPTQTATTNPKQCFGVWGEGLAA